MKSSVNHAHDSHAGPMAEELDVIHHSAVDKVLVRVQCDLGRFDTDGNIASQLQRF